MEVAEYVKFSLDLHLTSGHRTMKEVEILLGKHICNHFLSFIRDEQIQAKRTFYRKQICLFPISASCDFTGSHDVTHPFLAMDFF